MTTAEESSSGIDRRRMLGAGVGAVGGVGALGLLAAGPAAAAANEASFWAFHPRRVVDSRDGEGTARGKIRGGQTRTVDMTNIFNYGYAVSVILNVTVLQTEATGFLTLYENGQPRPAAYAAIWSGTGRAATSMTVTGLRASDQTFNVYCNGAGSTHFVLDMVGYFHRQDPPRRSPAERR